MDGSSGWAFAKNHGEQNDPPTELESFRCINDIPMIAGIQNTMLIFVQYLRRLIVMLAFASPQVHFRTNHFGTPFPIRDARGCVHGGDRGGVHGILQKQKWIIPIQAC